ncbi:MAG: hypothetical protein ACMUIG_09020 [Thermoplasmatota archaeon]
MGALMSIASNFEFTERNVDLQFFMGILMMILGFLLWAIPEIGRYMRKKQRQAEKRQRKMQSQEDRGGRRYAQPRR